MSNVKKCGDCAKWDYTSNNFGFCRAKSPSPTVVQEIKGGEMSLVWPSTGANDWCMEFEATKLPESVQ